LPQLKKASFSATIDALSEGRIRRTILRKCKNMKQFLAILGGVAITASIIVLGFTLVQVQQERNSLISDIEQRTMLLAESLKESVEPYYLTNSTDKLQKVVDKFANKERIIGIVIYNSKGEIITVSAGLPEGLPSDSEVPSLAMDSDEPSGSFDKIDNSQIYSFAEPLHSDAGGVVGALVVIQRADYINAAIVQIWKNSLIKLLIQVIFFSLIGALALKWIIVKPLSSIIGSLRSAHGNNSEDGLDQAKKQWLFKPLASEIDKLSTNLRRARSTASEEARLRLEKTDTPWTEERLKEFTKAFLKDRIIFTVSSREPFIHEKDKNGITYKIPASGMVTGVEPLMEACGGVWLAHGSGNADKLTVDSQDKIMVPPDDPKYTLKRVWLTEKNIRGYYLGFSNEALWPLCLMAHTRPIFRKEDWQEYQLVNSKFAQSLLAEIKDVPQPLILIQDFHFALLPKMIKKIRPDAQIGLFWHIPWPSPELFSICPWRKEILQGLLGADVIGFHTQLYGNNFIETVRKEVESLIDYEQFTITRNSHATYVKTFPISVSFTDGKDQVIDKEKEHKILDKFNIKTKYVGLGVDRLDYVKGILERFKGIEFFLDTYPSFRKEFTFLQIAPPTREGVEKYRQFAEDVTSEAERINQKFKSNGWHPIVLLKEHYPHEQLNLLYRVADFCLITSLHDGMNLVAKEFVAERNDEHGVLILSQFTGAARDLKDALIINPYSAEQTAEAIHRALLMPKAEQKRRMKKMRDVVKNYTIYRWAAEIIKAVTSLG